MSDLSDRDRVTAILAKCAKHRARWPTEQNPSMTIKVRDVELLGRLLEALDTIDRLEAENAELKKRRYWMQYVEPKEGDGVDW